jgi:hypothetical protein
MPHCVLYWVHLVLVVACLSEHCCSTCAPMAYSTIAMWMCIYNHSIASLLTPQVVDDQVYPQHWCCFVMYALLSNTYTGLHWLRGGRKYVTFTINESYILHVLCSLIHILIRTVSLQFALYPWCIYTISSYDVLYKYCNLFLSTLS